MPDLNCSVLDIYPLLGNVSQEQLPLDVVLPLYHSVVQKRLNDLSVSTNNWFTKAVERNVQSDNFHLGISDFGTPVQVQVLTADAGIVPAWKPMRFVSFESLQDFRETGQIVVAFVGTGQDLRIIFNRNFMLPRRIKIWYEPSQNLTGGYESPNPIQERFLPFINFEVAVLCAPHIQDMTDSQMKSMATLIQLYSAQVMEMRDQWRALTEPQMEHRAYSKRRFDRRRFGGN